jgi:NAD(P)-dependent dehydrogenase (short-subunit alcohol dehydrogenase family)
MYKMEVNMSNIKTVLITGSSGGFGLLIARTLLEKGYTVLATMRDLDNRNATPAKELHTYAKDTKGTLQLLEIDVTSDASVDEGIRQAVEHTGHIDAVVNNAGFGVGGYAEGFTIDQFQKIFEVNVFGVQRVNRAVLPAMRKQGFGLLIHISSVIGRVVIPFAGPYTATKFALEGLAESYRYELAGTGVDAVIVEPGGFGTGFGDSIVYPADEERIASYGTLAEMPDQMWGNFMQMLASDDAPDPQAVADAVLKLIETPAGQRPLRTVVDPLTGGEGPAVMNKTSDQVQEQMLSAFGLAELLSVKESG